MLSAPLRAPDSKLGLIEVGTRRQTRRFSPTDAHLLTLFGHQLGLAIANADLRSRVHVRRTEEQSALLGQASGLLATDDPDAIVQRAAEAATTLLGADGALAALCIPDGKLLAVRASVGWAPALVGQHLPADSRWVGGYALRRSETVAIEDAEREPDLDLPPVLRAQGIRSLLVTRLAWHGPGQGVLLVGRREVQPFDGEAARLLGLIATQVAIALTRAAERAQERACAVAQAAELERLRQDRATTVAALATSLDQREGAAPGHAQRVAAYSRRLAEVLGLAAGECVAIERNALFHAVRHEDATNADTLADRVLAVAHTLDEWLSAPPNPRTRGYALVRQYLSRAAGTQYDPLVVEAFLGVPPREWEALRAIATTAVAPSALV